MSKRYIAKDIAIDKTKTEDQDFMTIDKYGSRHGGSLQIIIL